MAPAVKVAALACMESRSVLLTTSGAMLAAPTRDANFGEWEAVGRVGAAESRPTARLRSPNPGAQS
jgi:hypothetical protein